MTRPLAIFRLRPGFRPRTLLTALARWRRRQRSRSQLARLEHWQLRDVGLTPRQARHEAARWF